MTNKLVALQCWTTSRPAHVHILGMRTVRPLRLLPDDLSLTISAGTWIHSAVFSSWRSSRYGPRLTIDPDGSDQYQVAVH